VVGDARRTISRYGRVYVQVHPPHQLIGHRPGPPLKATG
jgi:hypothetical protein